MNEVKERSFIGRGAQIGAILALLVGTASEARADGVAHQPTMVATAAALSSPSAPTICCEEGGQIIVHEMNEPIASRRVRRMSSEASETSQVERVRKFLSRLFSED